MIKDTIFLLLKILLFVPFLVGMILFTFPFSYAQDLQYNPHGDSAIFNHWVDSVFKSMTPDERLGQLFMVEASSKWRPQDKLFQKVETYIDSCYIGGVIFFYGGPYREAALINRLQERSRIPLMIAQDGEWGLAMRLDSVPSFPRNLCLGAIRNDEIIYELGREVGMECRRLGVNIDFMPCVDVYDNLGNTVIANRSFGSNKVNVARKGAAIMSGMSDLGILTTAKHFPGHGNTETDSHEALPIIRDNYQKIDTLDLYPFKYLINNGVQGVMVGHLFLPSIEKNGARTPASISKAVINDLLIDTLHFNGLVFTDALQMKGVSKDYPSGELELRAFEAGVDVFLMPSDCMKAFSTMKQAIASGRISQAEVDRRCKKILSAKRTMGLHKYKPVNLDNIYNELNSFGSKKLVRSIYENAVTLLQNRNNILPLRDLNDKRVALVSISKDGFETEFETYFNRYGNVDIYKCNKADEQYVFDRITAQVSDYDLVIVGVHGGNAYPSTFGTPAVVAAFVDNLANRTNVVVDIFNSPLALNRFSNSQKFAATIISYEDNEVSQTVSARLVMGSLPFCGQLSVTISDTYREGMGILTESLEVQ